MIPNMGLCSSNFYRQFQVISSLSRTCTGMAKTSLKSKTLKLFSPANLSLWGRSTLFSIFLVFTSIPKKLNASEGDFSAFQRGGTSFNRGTLSRDSRYPTYTLGFSRAFYTNVGKLGLELSNVVSMSHSTFYTLKEPELLFPVVAKAPQQLFEPAFLYNTCLFVYTRIHPCFGAGVSVIYLRHDSQNYVMYSAFPVQASLQLFLSSGVFLEGGATYRRFSQRQNGEVAWSEDRILFFGLGIAFLSQF